MKETCSEEFLGGQNHYELFDEWAQDVDGSTVGPYDSTISTLMRDVSIQYALHADGYETLDDALEMFKAYLRNTFSKVTVV